MKQLKITIIIFNLFGLVVQYGLSVARADVGPQLTRLSTQTADLEKENELLSGQISQSGSLASVETRATTLGLHPIQTQSLEPVRVALSRP